MLAVFLHCIFCFSSPGGKELRALKKRERRRKKRVANDPAGQLAAAA
jgi:hypothetical protein